MSENMLFCLGEEDTKKSIGYQHNNMVFNKQITEGEFNEIKKSLPEIKLVVSTWVDKKEMTDDEKENNSAWKETGGFLRTLNYEQAWAKWWSEATSGDKNKILDCEYFDAEVFTGITGIGVNVKQEPEIIELNGRKYKAIN